MYRELRFAIRLLRKQPGFASLAVLTLALGTGATSAVFSLIQGVVLRPPPYRQPRPLVLIPSVRTDGDAPQGWPAAQWLNWQKEARSFDAPAAYLWTFNFLIEPEGKSLEGMMVTADYFRVVGLQPVLGRAFGEAETTTGAAQSAVIIIGHDLWQRKFSGDPNVIGKTMRMSRQSTPTIVGVMPPDVRFLPSPIASPEPNYNVNARVDYWMPIAPNPDRLGQPFWDVVGRLKPGVSRAQAQADLDLIAEREVRGHSEFEGSRPDVRSLTTEMNRDGERILPPLLAAAALVLLVACGNVAALLLVRGLHRQHEYALRSALGLGRAGLFRQVAIESVVLAVLGGGARVVLAVGTVKVFQIIGGLAIPRLDAVTTGWPIPAAAFASAMVAATIAGVMPALRASRLEPIQVLKSAGPTSSAGRGERRLLRMVTIVQTALTLALLVGAGLLVRTMINLANVRSGYDTGHVVTVTVTAVQGDWGDLHLRALERISRLSGVQHTAFAWGVPLSGNSWPGAAKIEGRPITKPSDRPSVRLRAVTPGYFDLLKQPIVVGRDFRASDTRSSAGVAIVNQAFVDRYFPSAQALGKKLWFGGRQRPPNEFVGIVANSRTDDLTRAAQPEIYLCLWQSPAFSKDLVVFRQLILSEGYRMISAGILLGLAGALFVSHALRSFLFDVSLTDPSTFASAGALFAAVALLACVVPAGRAASINPLEALRE
jgi:putative ABC transport system permease protein